MPPAREGSAEMDLGRVPGEIMQENAERLERHGTMIFFVMFFSWITRTMPPWEPILIPPCHA